MRLLKLRNLIQATEQAPRNKALLAIAISCALIAWLDYASGPDLRVFPLYFVPIALSAWRFSLGAAVLLAALCSGLWLVANLAAGMHALPTWLPLTNALVQFAMFAFIGWLMAENKAALEHERQLARTDALTHVFNSRGFRERARTEVSRSRRQTKEITVACMDLDHFKAVNDSMGHAKGDAVLSEVGRILLSRVRATDVVGRIGGDEFVLLLPDTGVAGASTLLNDIRAHVQAAAVAMAVPVTASIGAVVFVQAPGDLEESIRAADEQLYLAKRSGRNQVLVASAPVPLR